MMKLLVLALFVASAAALPRTFSRVPGGGRIVGGAPAREGEFPHQVSLRWSSGSHVCGGSVIGPNTVLTAAHCVEGLDNNPGSVSIVCGKHRRAVQGANEQVRTASQIVIHAQYNPRTYLNDIALIKFQQPLNFNTYCNAIPLPSANQEESGSLQVSGWGTLSSGGQLADILQWVEVPYVSDSVCQSNYPQETIAPSMICAGTAGKDSCQGDSGGPLTDAGRSRVAGVVSWGYGCAAAGYPGVYTQVSHFISWINSNNLMTASLL